MKILVAHPGLQHSLKTCEGLYLDGILFKFVTSVYDKPSFWISIIKRIMPDAVKKKISKRKSTILPNDKILLLHTFKGLVLLFIYKLPIPKCFIDFFYRYVDDAFGKAVAYYAIKNNVDAVIMYDTTTNVCFKILKEKASHILRIQDVSIANRLFMKHNYLIDIQKTNDNSLQREQYHLWNKRNINRYKEEIELTQYFIVASNMSKRSLIFSNVDEKYIKVIPYGVDQNKFLYVPRKPKNDKLLKLIYVGQITYRKGIHHLLKVITERFSPNDVDLKLIGFHSKESLLYKQYKDYPNIHFIGFVDHERLTKYYNESDVFVFPTLGEGYGLVVLEALSCGLPVICSNLAGGDDAIIEGYNGFVFEAGNDNDLYSKIKWFIDNQQMLSALSENSKKSSLNYTWDKYYKNIAAYIRQIVNDNK